MTNLLFSHLPQLLDLLNWYLADLFGLEILIELCKYSNIVWYEP